MEKSTKVITLKHLLINKEKKIGLKFYPDKVIQALVKELPNPKWSEEFGMVYVANNPANLKAIFSKFKGVAWVNCGHFLGKKAPSVQGEGRQTFNPDNYRNRENAAG